VDNIKMDLREIGWGGMDWIDPGQDRDQSSALVNTIMKLRVPYNCRHFFCSSSTGGYPTKAQLRGVSLIVVWCLRVGYLTTLSVLRLYSFDDKIINEYRTIGRGNRSTLRKPATHDITWERTRAAVLESRWLAAWAMARPVWSLRRGHFVLNSLKTQIGVSLEKGECNLGLCTWRLCVWYNWGNPRTQLAYLVIRPIIEPRTKEEQSSSGNQSAGTFNGGKFASEDPLNW
jgi:hypothetical protein